MKYLIIALALALFSGQTFAAGEAVETMRVPAGGIHPQALTDTHGHLHVIYFKGDPSHGDVYYIKSTDNGKTFSQPLRVNSQAESVIAIGTVRAPQFALGKNDRVHVTWMGSGTAEPKAAGNAAPMLYSRMNAAGDGFEPQRNLIQLHPGLDGGVSLAADSEGNVYAAWHSPDTEKTEAGRKVWISRSADDGATFAPEASAIADKTGACGCCGMKIFSTAGGHVYVLFRAAHETMHREMDLLVSDDFAKTFKIALSDPFEIGVCVMSTSAFAPTQDGMLSAWETSGQIIAMDYDAKKTEKSLIPMPGSAGTRKHPALAANSRGEYVVAWTEGTGWNKGGSIAWQLFDKTGKPQGKEGRAEGLPAWSAAGGVCDFNGSIQDYVLIIQQSPRLCYNVPTMPQPIDYESAPVDAPAAAPPKGALAIIFVIVFMDLMGFGIIIPLLPMYAKDYRASDFQVGLLFSVFSACQFIASPILGIISDRFGRRPVLVFSQLGSAAGYLLLGIVMQIHWTNVGYALLLIYLSRLIDGLSGGNISTAQAYISDVTTKENRAKGMGVLGAAFGVGFAFGPMLGAGLVTFHASWPGYAAAVMSFGAMIVTFLRLPESRVHKPAESAAWLHPSRFMPILRHSRLMQLLLIAFISMAAFVMLESMVALFLIRPETFSFKNWQVGLYYGYLGIIIATVQGGLIGRLTKRFGEWPLAIIGPLFVAAGMGSLVITGYHAWLWLLLYGGAINAAGRSLQTPTLYSLISRNSDPKEQGLVFGLNQGLGSIARVIGPAVAAVLFHWRIVGPFAMAAAIVLIASVWTAMLRTSTKKDTAEFGLTAEAGAAESV